jgi:hypothetical protein
MSTSSSEGGPVSIIEALPANSRLFPPKPQHRRINGGHNAAVWWGQKITKKGRKLSQILETRQLPKILTKHRQRNIMIGRHIADKFINITVKH